MYTQTTWIGHVHYKTGDVKEVQVAAPKGNKHEALMKVLTAVGLNSVSHPDILGVHLLEDRPGAVEDTFGKLARPSNKQVPVVLPPAKKLKRYAIEVYLSPSQAALMKAVFCESNPFTALQSYVGKFGIEDMNNLGDYLVTEITPQGEAIPRMKKGQAYKSVVIHKPHIKMTDIPVVTSAPTQRSTSVAVLAHSERKVIPKQYRIIKPLTHKELT